MELRSSWSAFLAGAVAVGGTLVGMPALHNHATAGTEQFSFANSYTLNHPHNACGTTLVQQRMNSAGVQLDIYASSQLGGDADRVASLLADDIDLDLQGSSALASVHEPIGVMDMAFVFDDPDHLFRWFDSPESDELKDDFEEATGAKILDVWYYGDRTFSANKPIREPADLQGMRLRYPDSAAHLMSAAAMGAEPVAVAFEEVYLVLQQGIVDGQENPIGFTAENSLDEVVDYVSLSRHSIGSQLVIVSDRAWDALDPSQQEDLQEAVSQVREQNRECTETDERENLARWQEQGSPEVVEDVDRDAFREKAFDYYDEHLDDEERDVFESIRSTAEAAS